LYSQCQLYNFSISWERESFFHKLASKWGSNFPRHKSASKCFNLGLENSLDVLENYGNFLKGQTNVTCDGQSLPNEKYNKSVRSVRKITIKEDDEVVKFVNSYKGHARNGKSWVWQTCYEFGYFQVADPEIKLFSVEWTTLIDVRRCQAIFPDSK
jgi:hypothetical protein